MTATTEILHNFLMAARNGNDTQLRRNAQRADPDQYSSYNPETFLFEQIGDCECHCEGDAECECGCRNAIFVLLNMILNTNRKLEYLRLAITKAATSTNPTIDAAELAATVTAHFDILGEEDVQPTIEWERRAHKAWEILLKELYLPNEDPAADTSDAYRRRLVHDVLGPEALETRKQEIKQRLGFEPIP
jgi:hypothetical protein